MKLTLLLAVVAVPINTVFGVVAALQITRNEFPGKTFAMALLDLPFSISPVVTGTLETLKPEGIPQQNLRHGPALPALQHLPRRHMYPRTLNPENPIEFPGKTFAMALLDLPFSPSSP